MFESLEAAFLGTYVGEGPRWGVIADIAYTDLEQGGRGPLRLLGYEVEVKQALFTLYGTYRLWANWQATFGARWTDVKSALSLRAAGRNRFRSTWPSTARCWGFVSRSESRARLA